MCYTNVYKLAKEVQLMKLVYAIVRNDNEDDVVSQLTQHHYSVTRLSTTGGFLKRESTTFDDWCRR